MRRYPDSGWGGYFAQWLFSEQSAPYHSYGNGAAMRVSPAGLLGRTLDEALYERAGLPLPAGEIVSLQRTRNAP